MYVERMYICRKVNADWLSAVEYRILDQSEAVYQVKVAKVQTKMTTDAKQLLNVETKVPLYCNCIKLEPPII